MGKNGIPVTADMTFDREALKSAEALVLPGGAVIGEYEAHDGLAGLLREHAERGGLTAAVCAAPTYLASLGLLKGRTAVCYPALEGKLTENGVAVGTGLVEESGCFITSKGPGTTPLFALAVAGRLKGREAADKVRAAFLL